MKARLVYSSELGRVCPTCGWPATDCKCSRALAEPLPSRPGKIVAKLRVEKKGRGGKTVTVLAGLPRNATFLRDLCSELKRVCGTGGAVSDDTIELQGDLRDRVREHLLKKEFVVKG
jgi:translation initiation factor 1